MRITVGMATINDADGVYFTIMSALHQHKQLGLRFVVVDNSPETQHGEEVKKFCAKVGAKYVPMTQKVGTSVRNEVFYHADDGLVVCVDSHVQIQNGGIEALARAAKDNDDVPTLLSGPLLYEGWFTDTEYPGKHCATHWEPVWGKDSKGKPVGMLGQWARDERVIKWVPFDIPMQGLGMFASLRKHWQGFSPYFNGFGGEEGYIHEKYRRAGGRVLCVPQAGWSHRFFRVADRKYSFSVDQLCLNYLIGRIENEQDFEDVKQEFNQMLPPGRVDKLVDQAYQLLRRKVITK